MNTATANGKAQFESSRQRPVPLDVLADPIPGELRSLDQWVCWVYEWDKNRKKWIKVPFDQQTGRRASSTDPRSWCSFNDALTYYKAHRSTVSGIGFVFADGGGITGIDLDHCRDRDSGKVEPWAAKIVRDCGTYTEVSPSGTGVKLFCRASLPEGHRCRRGPIEIYCRERFFVVTGHRCSDTPLSLADCQSQVEHLLSLLEAGKKSSSPAASAPPLPLSDSELIERAMASANGDKFRRLWAGDTAGYDSHSEADLALVNLLAFACGGPDPERIDRLFRSSGMMREKWEREDYRRDTISRALDGRTEYYRSGPNGKHSRHDAATKAKPSAKGCDHDGWEQSTQFLDSPPVDPFPLEVFPRPLQSFASEAALALNCPVDYFALPMLTIAGGCIGNSRWLSITRSHEQSAALFACVVGTKGSGKSPALKKVRDPLDKAQRIFFENWKREIIAAKEAAEAAEAEEEERDAAPPILKRCIVGDTTTETFSIILDENPRGLVQVRDELSGMLASLNQYKHGGGHDRQWYLELWSHTLSPRDRKSDKRPPVFLDRPMVGIIGGTQPDVVERFRGESFRGVPPPDDGFLDRWLFAFPAEPPAKGETWLEISPEATVAWEGCIGRLLALQGVPEDGGERPFFLHLDASGKLAWHRFTCELAEEINSPDFPDFLRGFWAKLRGYAGRLALIVHMLRVVCGEMAEGSVDGESMERAVKLVHYFKSHARKTYSVMGADARIVAAKKILAWIIREKRTEFKRWEAHKDLQSDCLFPSPESLDRPLELLSQHNIIRQREARDTGKAGRKPSPIFEVNPLCSNRENRVNRVNAGHSHDLPDSPDHPKGDAWEGLQDP